MKNVVVNMCEKFQHLMSWRSGFRLKNDRALGNEQSDKNKKKKKKKKKNNNNNNNNVGGAWRPVSKSNKRRAVAAQTARSRYKVPSVQ